MEAMCKIACISKEKKEGFRVVASFSNEVREQSIMASH